MGSFFYSPQITNMFFNFLPYQFSQVLNDFTSLQFKHSEDKADMYKHLNPPNSLLGYQIKDVFLYFVCNNLVASLITLNHNNIYFKPLLDKLTELLGTKPTIHNNYYKWATNTEILYFYYDKDSDVIRLYYTILEYDVMV